VQWRKALSRTLLTPLLHNPKNLLSATSVASRCVCTAPVHDDQIQDSFSKAVISVVEKVGPSVVAIGVRQASMWRNISICTLSNFFLNIQMGRVLDLAFCLRLMDTC